MPLVMESNKKTLAIQNFYNDYRLVGCFVLLVNL